MIVVCCLLFVVFVYCLLCVVVVCRWCGSLLFVGCYFVGCSSLCDVARGLLFVLFCLSCLLVVCLLYVCCLLLFVVVLVC